MRFPSTKYFHQLVFISIIFLLGCAQSGKESRDGSRKSSEQETTVIFDLEKIKERGTLKALVDNSSTSYFIYKGNLMGYEYELLTLLAEELGVQLEIIVTKSIDDAFAKLNSGEGDIIAFTLTITKERQKRVAFTNALYTTRQILVQKKPVNWREMKLHEIEELLIRNQVELIGKEVHVRRSSSYVDRLNNLSEEIGGDIRIIEDDKDIETELMIKKVADGEVKYTIADEDIAMVNASYYPDLDIKTAISFPQQIAWAVRLNSPQLLNYINDWQSKIKRGPDYNVIYNKYYKSPRSSVSRMKSDFSSLQGDKLTVYDDQIKATANDLGWDWRLLAAQMYQESGFMPNEVSWAGAIGLMQLVPETGARFGADNLKDPDQNIKAAGAFLKYLEGLWGKTITNEKERIKFTLASYNVGLGHVIDARELAEKYDKDPKKWDDNVEFFLLNKSKPKYFNDPVCKSGYCRGEEPVNYVRDIINRFEQYKQLLQ